MLRSLDQFDELVLFVPIVLEYIHTPPTRVQAVGVACFIFEKSMGLGLLSCQSETHK